jgi:hypothetical protein
MTATTNFLVWRALRRRLEKMGGEAHVEVGVLSGQGADLSAGKGFTMGNLAAVHEYGSDESHIPARAPIGTTFREGEEEVAKFITDLGGAIVARNLEPQRALEMLGAKGVGMVKKRVARGKYLEPALKQKTIDRKGSSRPLVDKGHLLNSFSFRVVLR